MLGKSISTNSIILTIFALGTVGVIAATQISTKDRIALEQRKAQEKALLEIIPRDQHDNQMLDNTIMVNNSELLGLSEEKKIYLAKKGNEVVAAIIPAQANLSYSGEPIKLIVGVNKDDTVAGVRVVFHKETPGLGDAIDIQKDDWILDFNGKSLFNPDADGWNVKKDKGVFDQFTGATITPRAVVKSVYSSLVFAKENHELLFAPKEIKTDTDTQIQNTDSSEKK